MNCNQYNTSGNKRTGFIVIVSLLAVVVALIGWTIGTNANRAAAEDGMVKVWVMCKPGSYVIVRRNPSKKAMEVGRLDPGDWVMTDGESSNGFIKVYGIGENGVGFVYSGFVVTEEPRAVMENYICTSNARVACRRWIGGPKVERTPWIKNGSNVTVFYQADEWSCTSRGFIKSEYLEADPE